MSTADIKNFSRKQAVKLSRGFTLVEILVAMSIGVALMGAVAVLFVTTARLIYKNQQIDAACSNTRIVQEHIYGQLSLAISQPNSTNNPTLTGSTFGSNPIRAEGLTYRVPIGSYATVAENTASSSKTLKINPRDVTPQKGDYLLMDEPNLVDGILIASVVPGTSGTLTVTLAESLSEGTEGEVLPASLGKFVRIQRERRYTTVAPETLPDHTASSPVTELHWYETTANTTPDLILSKNVDASARYLFTLVQTSGSTELALSWQFNYRTADSNTGRLAGVSNADMYQINKAEGLIMPKSGDPMQIDRGTDGGGFGKTTKLPSSSTSTTKTPKTKTGSSDDKNTTKTTQNFDG